MIYVVIDDLIDYAETHSSVTGIQRVIIENVKAMCDLIGHDQIKLVNFKKPNELIFYNSDLFVKNYEFSQKEFIEFFYDTKFDNLLSLNNYVRKKYRGFAKAFHKIRLRAINYLTAGKTFQKRNIISKMINNKNISNSQSSNNLSIKDGDHIFIPGCFWSHAAQEIYKIKESQKLNIKLLVQVHDLTPIQTPEFCDEYVRNNFERIFRDVLRNATRIVTVSQYTRSDILMYARENNFICPEVSAVQLAHEFVISRSELKDLSLDVHYLLRFKFVITVGFLDGRKNILSLIRVWRWLEQELGPKVPHLAIIGTKAITQNLLENSLNYSGNLFGLVHIIQSPSDFELSVLYKKAQFTVYPSFFEGWGLPVGESLWFGTPVITSHSSSLPEVGLNLADYFEHGDDINLYNACKKMILDADHYQSKKRAINRQNLRKWSDVSEDLMAVLKLEFNFS